ncbi:MAG: succinyl-diaminopimelate desuccinylase [Candidatus Berkiellales bacterium]
MSNTLEFAKALLACPSVTPEDNGCQTLIAEKLAQMGFTVSHLPVNQVSNLWAKKGTNAPVFCFAGHTDVVPPGELNAWQSPPFTPTLRDNKLYARGAADMKSSIAAMITACERFLTKYPAHQSSIAFLITSDEEGPAKDGTQAVLKMLSERKEIPQWCLVGEASSSEKLGDAIRIGRRGSITGYLKIFGVQGHVAYPQLAKNPIHNALSALQAITSQKWDHGDQIFPATSLQFANIHAGTGATNVIPGVLEANFNLRYSPQSSPEVIQKTIETLLRKHDLEFELNWHLGAKPFYTTASSVFVQKIVTIITHEMGYAPELSTAGGTSDGRFFAEYGCEVVELGPNNATIHQVNECIDLKQLEQLSMLYEKILMACVV